MSERYVSRMRGTAQPHVRMRTSAFLRPFAADITHRFELRVGFDLVHFGRWNHDEAVQEIDKLTAFLAEVRQELMDRIEQPKQEE